MLAAARNQRFLDTVQVVLTFVSVCAVVDASRIDTTPESRASYQASVPLQSERSEDRRLADLARNERQRREAEQRASRRGSSRTPSHAALPT